MKRWMAACLLAVTALTLTACGSSGAETCGQLVDRYLDAVAQEDYEAVCGLLPEQVVKYGEQELEGNRQDVLEFIAYGVSDYSWLTEADLPAHPDFTYRVTGTQQEETEGVRAYFEKRDLRLDIQEAASLAVEIDTGEGEPISASFFMIRLKDGWYLTSVTGDDELFFY